MRVDLPAPFSPRMPWISPGISSSDTSLHATIGPYRLVIDESRTAGADA